MALLVLVVDLTNVLGVYFKQAHFTMIRDSARRILYHWYNLGGDNEYSLGRR